LFVLKMARVFERPRYANQARNKLISVATASTVPAHVKLLAGHLGLSAEAARAACMAYDDLAELALDLDREPEDLPGLDENLEQYLLDSAIGIIETRSSLLAPQSARRLTEDILAVFKLHNPTTVYSDEGAIFSLIHEALWDTSPAMLSRDAAAAFSVQRRHTVPVPWHEDRPWCGWGNVCKGCLAPET
jgi:hypothetical protein